MSGLNKVYDCMIVSAMWCLLAIPIITIGPATTALYYTVNKSIRHNRGYAWKEFWSAFRSNFKQSTIVWLLNLLLIIIGLMDVYILKVLGDSIPLSDIIKVLMVAFMLFLVMWMFYVYPYIARFTIKTKPLIKNCAIIAMLNFHWTLLLLVLFVVCGIAFLFVPIFSLFVPGIFMVIANRILEKVFRKYMSKEDIEAEDERNREEYN